MAQGTEQNLEVPIDPSGAQSTPPAAETAERAQKYQYDAFVSYRRRDATGLAQWIRSRLQRFRLPPEILSQLSRQKEELHERRPQIWLVLSLASCSSLNAYSHASSSAKLVAMAHICKAARPDQ
jgi:hypothetical protein